MRPKTLIDAPHPQNERGQPAGRPPTTCPFPSVIAAWARRGVERGSLEDECLARFGCIPETSHGIVTLHSGAKDRYGRASKALDESPINIDQTNTIAARIGGLRLEPCPEPNGANLHGLNAIAD